MSLYSELRTLLAAGVSALAGTPAEAEVNTLAARLNGPLRVAIAGRVKAGKSTLLNALVGERLAPTDAGECTRFVTWYGYGEGYDVWYEGAGGRRPLRFSREDGRLNFQLDDATLASDGRIRVEWPSARLRGLTIIDTPGLGSANDDVSARTEAALTDRENAPEADAVVYLMRHMHATDVAFLEAFLDTEASELTPVNSVAVLSRADEIGGGRLDALDSARRICLRYENDPRIRSLTSAVVPVAGLLAETAATLQENEAECLRIVAREPAGVAEGMLISVDAFRAPETGTLTRELREELLARFGLFGVRLAVAAFRDERWKTAAELARLLTDESGIGALDELLRTRFGARSQQLVARTVLEGFRNVLQRVGELGAAADLLVALEQLEAASHEVSELRMLDLVWSGVASFDEAERREAERATGAGSAAERLGCPAAAPAEAKAAAIASIGRWRERAADPFTDRQTAICCETLARTYEGLYAALDAS